MVKDKGQKLKLDDRTREGIMLGYNEANRCFRIWDIKRKEVMSSRDVTIFEESNKLNKSTEQRSSGDELSVQKDSNKEPSVQKDSNEELSVQDSSECETSDQAVDQQSELKRSIISS